MKRKFAVALSCLSVAAAVQAGGTCIIDGSTNRVAVSTCESSICGGLVVSGFAWRGELLEKLERAVWTSAVSDAAEIRLKYNFYLIIK